jgi:hypothetical protein
MSSEAVIKAFEGRRAFQTSDNTAKAKRALEIIKVEAEEG